MELLQQLIGMALFVKELLRSAFRSCALHSYRENPVDRFWSWAEIDAVKAYFAPFMKRDPASQISVSESAATPHTSSVPVAPPVLSTRGPSEVPAAVQQGLAMIGKRQ